MIDLPVLVAWRSHAPWPSTIQVEQDLLLSRLMIEIADDKVLGEELVMRGGTCLHKLHLPSPLRYSEDLDYVRRTHSGIKPITSALGRIAEKLELTVGKRRRAGQMVQFFLETEPTEGLGIIRIKVEINVAETKSHQPLTSIVHTVDTSWWQGEAAVPTFIASELLSTKLRALYQRRKGRDLFDLWLGLTELIACPDEVLAGLNHYMRGAVFSFPEFNDNLAAKLESGEFCSDLDGLVMEAPNGYDVISAADLVLEQLGRRMRNAPLDLPSLKTV